MHYDFPFWDAVKPTDLVPIWVAPAINSQVVLKLETNKLGKISSIRVGCAKCNASEPELFTAELPNPERMTIQLVPLQRVRVCWGHKDGTAELMGTIWAGTCPACKTEHLTWLDATAEEKQEW